MAQSVDDAAGAGKRSRGFSRLAWWTARSQQTPEHPKALAPLLQAVAHNHPKADIDVVLRAYRVAEKAHDGQMRKSGDPYITHPVAVATILAEIGLTPTTLAAALLHDTVEDTEYSLDRLRADFGEEIAVMVDGVTKLDKIEYGSAAQSETVRKMIVAMSRDIRVLVIKLADRLHNARTWKYVPAASSTKKATETLEIFAPLAHRLGMNTIKWELEDLSFQVLYPKVYSEIVRLVAERAPEREKYLGIVSRELGAELSESKIDYTISGRPKHYYSIYQKMVVRGHDFAEIYDLVGVRVLVETVRECYAVLGHVHARWSPVAGRFKDYIAMPKFNLYQSLHTTVLGPGGKPVELQIRTHEMHRQAEFGVAAHWRYKEGKSAGDQINWVQSISEWQKETEDSGEFLDTFTEEIAKNEVFVFSPKGDVISLPAGSTPVDFAYAIHTEVGHRCIGARVNGKLVPLDSHLEMGMVVDIITSKAQNAGPSRDWLSFVKTPRARSKIRQHFTRERRDEAIEHGKEMLSKQMRRAHVASRLLTPEVLAGLVQHFHVSDVPSLWAAIGEGTVGPQAVVAQIVQTIGGGEAVAEASLVDEALLVRPMRKLPRDHSGVVVDGDPDMYTKLAKCCLPVPGDPILGFVTRSEGISVHREDCTNVDSLKRYPERLVPVSWAPSADAAFLVAVQLEGIDRGGMLSDVTRVLSDLHMSIVSVSANASKDHVFTMRLTFQTPDPRHLDTVLRSLQRVPGVYEVSRVKPG